MRRHIVPLLIATTLLLTSCESPEETAARLAQHNGKTVAEVSAQIGAPRKHTPKQATWIYKHTAVHRVPIQHFINGYWITTGYRTERTRYHCVFRAKLKNNRVIASDIQGTGCHNLAPSLKRR
ncbi:MAG: hypothetical protein GY947_11775 [Rhodobacteraceae bacterium]|nr:hypothetical protein [Paracoccaceae bacterium]